MQIVCKCKIYANIRKMHGHTDLGNSFGKRKKNSLSFVHVLYETLNLIFTLQPCRGQVPSIDIQIYAPIKSKLQHPPPPPPRANPGHLTIFCARGVGNLTGKAFPGWGICLGGVGKIEPEVSNGFFGGAPKSLTAINTCLDEMEEFKGRDIAFVSDWLTKKGLQKLCSIFEGMFEKKRVLEY